MYLDYILYTLCLVYRYSFFPLVIYNTKLVDHVIFNMVDNIPALIEFPYIPPILIHQPHRIVGTICVRRHARVLVGHRINREPDGEVGGSGRAGMAVPRRGRWRGCDYARMRGWVVGHGAVDVVDGLMGWVKIGGAKIHKISFVERFNWGYIGCMEYTYSFHLTFQ